VAVKEHPIDDQVYCFNPITLLFINYYYNSVFYGCQPKKIPLTASRRQRVFLLCSLLHGGSRSVILFIKKYTHCSITHYNGCS